MTVEKKYISWVLSHVLIENKAVWITQTHYTYHTLVLKKKKKKEPNISYVIACFKLVFSPLHP